MESRVLSTSLSVNLLRLFSHIGSHRRYQFIGLLSLTVISSFFEVVSLGAVIPLVGILTQPEEVLEFQIIKDIMSLLGISPAADLVLIITIVFGVAAILAGGLRMVLLWVSINLGNAIGIDLGGEVFRRTLYQPYSVHVSRSSGAVISAITLKVQVSTSVLISLVTIVTSAILFIFISGTLILIDPLTASVAMMSFGAAYVVVLSFTRVRLKKNSYWIAREQTQIVKILQEGLGAIRDVLLDGTQDVYCDTYTKAIRRLRKSGGENRYMNQAPRYFMESVAMVLIAIFAYVMSVRPGGIVSALPMLAALALGAQRLVPLLQQLYSNWAILAGSQVELADVLEYLEQPLSEDSVVSTIRPMLFQHEIKFNNVSFRYNNNDRWNLDGINLTIPKGSCVGFSGKTGSGKSTTLDLIMSLIEPTQGEILVDTQKINSKFRRSWQSTIAHVPQSIFLADGTIVENIAFGVSEKLIDHERVRQAAKQAQIADFIESCTDGYNSSVGERGIRISGGQRQRIGIARALYKGASVLILDEATSALDIDTETKVMSAIQSNSSDITILIIAHRIDTLKNCDIRFHLEHGKVVQQFKKEVLSAP